MGQKKTLWIAIGLSFLAWFLYRLHIGRKTEEITQLYGCRTFVWSASRDMLPGYEIQAEDLSETEIPLAFVQPGAMTNQSWSPAGEVVQAPVRKGEQILVTKLAREGSGMLSLRVGTAEEMRAMTLKFDGEGGMAGLLQPNDRIDVIGVFESAASSSDITRSHAVVLAQNLKVLAVDQRMGEQAAGGSQVVMDGSGAVRTSVSVPGSIHVTVQATASESWRLSLASQMAYLRCILRNRRNDKINSVQPPSERLPSLKGDEVFGARVPVKIRASSRATLDELGTF